MIDYESNDLAGAAHLAAMDMPTERPSPAEYADPPCGAITCNPNGCWREGCWVDA